jgi:predicted phage tail protein
MAGYLLEGRFDFKTITNPYQAEEMAEIILRRSRESLTLAINVAFNSYDLAIGDIVNITHSSLGFSAKPFRVLSLTFNEDYSVGLNLVEHQNSHYTWASKTQQATIPTTNLPNPFSIQPPASVTLSDQLIEYNDGTVIVALDIALTASPDSFVDYYQVEYKLSSDTNYIIYAQGSGLNHRVLNVIDQETYDVRVKAVNALGISSTYVSASRKIIGALALPSDVEEFACNVIGQEAHLSWKSIPDLDLAYYSIRFSDVLSGAEWANSVNLIEKVSRPATSIVVPARVGSYLIKAVDKLGNHSLNETVISSNISGIQNYNAVLTQDEHPLFLGVDSFDSAQGNFDDLTGDFDDGFETNLVVSDNKLRLDSKYNFDDGTGNFDDNTTKLFDSSPFDQSLELSGYYYFGTPIDIGSSQVSRLTASIKQTSDNVDVVFDSATGNFDDRAGAFDGDTPDFIRTILQISTSTDNITYSAYRDFTIGEYNARYFLFRVLLESIDGSSTPIIEELSVTIDMVDRLFSGNDIVSGTGTYTVTFTNPYYSPNYAIGVTAQSMNSGDTFTITNKTVNGFNIAFKNSSSIGVSKTFDFLTKGH